CECPAAPRRWDRRLIQASRRHPPRRSRQHAPGSNAQKKNLHCAAGPCRARRATPSPDVALDSWHGEARKLEVQRRGFEYLLVPTQKPARVGGGGEPRAAAPLRGPPARPPGPPPPPPPAAAAGSAPAAA